MRLLALKRQIQLADVRLLSLKCHFVGFPPYRDNGAPPIKSQDDVSLLDECFDVC